MVCREKIYYKIKSTHFHRLPFLILKPINNYFLNTLNKETPSLQGNLFKNWSKEFLKYLDTQENPDFPNKTHRRMWGIDD